MTDMTKSERFLLHWLAKDIGQYGECHGEDLEALRQLGFVRCSGDDSEDVWPPPTMFHGVELTTRGVEAADRETPP